MSSYADVAKHGPAQSDEDKKANAVPEIVDSHAVETTDVTSQDHSINVVPSDFKHRDVQTDTQVASHKRDDEQAEQEATQEARAKKDEVEKNAKKVAKKTQSAFIAAGKDVRTYNLLDSVVLVALGVVGYRKYRDGQLDLQTASIGIAGLGIFAGLQGFVQRWFGKQ